MPSIKKAGPSLTDQETGSQSGRGPESPQRELRSPPAYPLLPFCVLYKYLAPHNDSTTVGTCPAPLLGLRPNAIFTQRHLGSWLPSSVLPVASHPSALPGGCRGQNCASSQVKCMAKPSSRRPKPTCGFPMEHSRDRHAVYSQPSIHNQKHSEPKPIKVPATNSVTPSRGNKAISRRFERFHNLSSSPSKARHRGHT